MVYERDFGYRENTANGRRQRLVSSIVVTVRVAVGRFIQWRRRHAAINALSALDDAMLKDIGLHRSQIVDAVYRAERGGVAGGRPNHEEAEASQVSPETGGDRGRSDDTASRREAA